MVWSYRRQIEVHAALENDFSGGGSGDIIKITDLDKINVKVEIALYN